MCVCVFTIKKKKTRQTTLFLISFNWYLGTNQVHHLVDQAVKCACITLELVFLRITKHIAVISLGINYSEYFQFTKYTAV